MSKRIRAAKRVLWVSRGIVTGSVRASKSGPMLAPLTFNGCTVTQVLLGHMEHGTTRRVEVVTAQPGFLAAVRELVEDAKTMRYSKAAGYAMKASAAKVGEMM